MFDLNQLHVLTELTPQARMRGLRGNHDVIHHNASTQSIERSV